MERTTRRDGATGAEIVRGQRDLLLPSMLHLYEDPLPLVEGKGVRVRDADGREYLDLFAGILTTSVGHCHPHVVEAVDRQMRRLGHVSTLYATEPQVTAARRIAEIAPGSLRRTFFTNSGTEAIETAIMMACAATGRSDVVALRGAYHGRSSMATTLTAHAGWRPLPTRVAGIQHAKAPDPYRCPFRRPCDATCGKRLAEDLEEVILTATNGRPAAFVAETIQGVSGYLVPPPGYLERAAEVIRRHGGLLIIDEVQTGFGRTGGRWFGIEHFGVVPDIMVMAKGIANGAPVGATTTTDEIAGSWRGRTISTYGGNPVAMAALVATQDVLRDEDAPARAEARGAQLGAGLRRLEREHAWIGDVRGMGLMRAMEVVEDPETRTPDAARTRRLLEAARAEGLLIGLGGLHGNVVRIGPSLLITEEEVGEGLDKLGRACARVDA